MFTLKRISRTIAALAAVAACLTAMPGTAHAQRGFKVNGLRNPTQLGGNQRTIYVPVRDTVDWGPPKIKGDHNFSGNGPEVWVRVKFFVQNNAVYRRVFMSAVETSSKLGSLVGDNSTAKTGWSPAKHIWSPPAGTSILALRGISENTVLVHDVFDKKRVYERSSVVGRMKITGHDYYPTRVSIDFNYNLPVVVMTSAMNLNRVTAHLPGTVEYTPPHIKGDKEFNGHGPRVNITAYITHSRNKVFFNVFMKAEEVSFNLNTKKYEPRSDYTTAAGYYSKNIYTAPAGKRIKEVTGKQMWRDVVSYVDKDHEVDTFSDPQLGRIYVKGDTKSYLDAGYRTKVTFPNIRHSVTVQLENE